MGLILAKEADASASGWTDEFHGTENPDSH